MRELKFNTSNKPLKDSATGEMGANPLDKKGSDLPVSKISMDPRTIKQTSVPTATRGDESFLGSVPDSYAGGEDAIATARQSWASKAGRTAVSGVASGVAGALSSGIGSFVGLASDEAENYIHELNNDWKTYLNENLKVHENPLKEDANWWDEFTRFSTANSIVNSAVEFGLLGLGVGAATRALGAVAMSAGSSIRGMAAARAGAASARQILGSRVHQIGNAVVNPKAILGSKISTTTLLNAAAMNTLEGGVMARETEKELESLYAPLLYNPDISKEEKDSIRAQITASGNKVRNWNKALVVSDMVGFSRIFPYGSLGNKAGFWKYLTGVSTVVAPAEGLEEIVQNVIQTDAQFNAVDGIEKELGPKYSNGIPGLEYNDKVGVGDQGLLWQVNEDKAKEMEGLRVRSGVDYLLSMATSDAAIVEGLSGVLGGGPQWMITGAPTYMRNRADNKAREESFNKMTGDLEKDYSNILGDKILSDSKLKSSIESMRSEYEGTPEEVITRAVENYAIKKLGIEASRDNSTDKFVGLMNDIVSEASTRLSKNEITQEDFNFVAERSKIAIDAAKESREINRYYNGDQLYASHLEKLAIEESITSIGAVPVTSESEKAKNEELVKNLEADLEVVNQTISDLKSADSQTVAYQNMNKKRSYHKLADKATKVSTVAEMEDLISHVKELRNAENTTANEKSNYDYVLSIYHNRLVVLKDLASKQSTTAQTRSNKRSSKDTNKTVVPTTTPNVIPRRGSTKKTDDGKGTEKKPPVKVSGDTKPASKNQRNLDGIYAGLTSQYGIKGGKKGSLFDNVKVKKPGDTKSGYSDGYKQRVNEEIKSGNLQKNMQELKDSFSFAANKGSTTQLNEDEDQAQRRFEIMENIMGSLKHIAGLKKKLPSYEQAKNIMDDVMEMDQEVLQALDIIYGYVSSTTISKPLTKRVVKDPKKVLGEDFTQSATELDEDNRALQLTTATLAHFPVKPGKLTEFIAWHNKDLMADYTRINKGLPIRLELMDDQEILEMESAIDKGIFRLGDTSMSFDEFADKIISGEASEYDRVMEYPIKVTGTVEGKPTLLGFVHTGNWYRTRIEQNKTKEGVKVDPKALAVRLNNLESIRFAVINAAEKGETLNGKVEGRKKYIRPNTKTGTINGLGLSVEAEGWNDGTILANDPNIIVTTLSRSSTRPGENFTPEVEALLKKRKLLAIVPHPLTEKGDKDFNGSPVVIMPAEDSKFAHVQRMRTKHVSKNDFELALRVFTDIDGDRTREQNIEAKEKGLVEQALPIEKLREGVSTPEAKLLNPVYLKSMMKSMIYLADIQERKAGNKHLFDIVAKDYTNSDAFVDPDTVYEKEVGESITVGSMEVKVGFGSAVPTTLKYDFKIQKVDEENATTYYTLVGGEKANRVRKNLYNTLSKANTDLNDVGRLKIPQYHIRNYALENERSGKKSGVLQAVVQNGEVVWEYKQVMGESEIVLPRVETTLKPPTVLANGKKVYTTNTMVAINIDTEDFESTKKEIRQASKQTADLSDDLDGKKDSLSFGPSEDKPTRRRVYSLVRVKKAALSEDQWAEAQAQADYEKFNNWKPVEVVEENPYKETTAKYMATDEAVLRYGVQTLAGTNDTRVSKFTKLTELLPEGANAMEVSASYEGIFLALAATVTIDNLKTQDVIEITEHATSIMLEKIKARRAILKDYRKHIDANGVKEKHSKYIATQQYTKMLGMLENSIKNPGKEEDSLFANTLLQRGLNSALNQIGYKKLSIFKTDAHATNYSQKHRTLTRGVSYKSNARVKAKLFTLPKYFITQDNVAQQSLSIVGAPMYDKNAYTTIMGLMSELGTNNILDKEIAIRERAQAARINPSAYKDTYWVTDLYKQLEGEHIYNNYSSSDKQMFNTVMNVEITSNRFLALDKANRINELDPNYNNLYSTSLKNMRVNLGNLYGVPTQKNEIKSLIKGGNEQSLKPSFPANVVHIKPAIEWAIKHKEEIINNSTMKELLNYTYTHREEIAKNKELEFPAGTDGLIFDMREEIAKRVERIMLVLDGPVDQSFNVAYEALALNPTLPLVDYNGVDTKTDVKAEKTLRDFLKVVSNYVYTETEKDSNIAFNKEAKTFIKSVIDSSDRKVVSMSYRYYGKLLTVFADRNFLTQELKKMHKDSTHLNQYDKDVYARHSLIKNLIQNSDNYPEGLSISNMFSEVYRGDIGGTWESAYDRADSELAHALFDLGYYMQSTNYRYNKGHSPTTIQVELMQDTTSREYIFKARTAAFRLPTISDKDATLVMNSIDINPTTIRENKTLELSNEMVDFYTDTVITPEINRIIQARHSDVEKDESFGYKYIYAIPKLNDPEILSMIGNINPNTELASLYAEDPYLSEDDNTSYNVLAKALRPLVKDYLIEATQKYINTLEKSGIIRRTDTKNNKGNYYTLTGNVDHIEDFRSLIADTKPVPITQVYSETYKEPENTAAYVRKDTSTVLDTTALYELALQKEFGQGIMLTNLKQLVSGDIADMYKKPKDSNGYMDEIRATIDNYTKRLAKIIAPGSMSEGTREAMVFFLDEPQKKSVHYNSSKGFPEFDDITIDRMDGIVYVSPNTHVNNMVEEGTIGEDERQTVLDYYDGKLKEVSENAVEGESITTDYADKISMVVRKPRIVENIQESLGNNKERTRSLYIKMAQAPVSKTEVGGSEHSDAYKIHRVIKQLEDSIGIDVVLATRSSVKTGQAINAINLDDLKVDPNTGKYDIPVDSYTSMSYEYYATQTKEEFHRDKYGARSGQAEGMLHFADKIDVHMKDIAGKDVIASKYLRDINDRMLAVQLANVREMMTQVDPQAAKDLQNAVYRAPKPKKPIPTDITELKDFEGTIIEYVDHIGKKKDGREIGARNVNKGEKIKVVLSAMKEKFKNKTWVTPPESEALPKDTFKTFEEFMLFMYLHEKAHEYILRADKESIGKYETRINNEALRRLGSEFESSYGLQTANQLAPTDRQLRATLIGAIENSHDLDVKVTKPYLIKWLDLDYKGEFEFPIIDSPYKQYYLNVLKATVERQTINMPVRRRSYPLKPDIYDLHNTRRVGDRDGVVLFSDMFDNNNIEADGKLRTHTTDGSTSTPAQILIPFELRDSDTGKDIDMESLLVTRDVLDKEGNVIDSFVTIDITKLPKELLESFGYRTPTQNMNMTAPIQVVGFLPKAVKHTVVVPAEFVTLWGHDFDIDTLYMYHPYYTQDKEGVISLVTEASHPDNPLMGMQNEVIRTIHTILKDPKVLKNNVIKALKEEESFKPFAEYLEDTIFTSNTSEPSFNSTAYQIDKRNQSVDSEQGIAVFAQMQRVYSALSTHPLQIFAPTYNKEGLRELKATSLQLGSIKTSKFGDTRSSKFVESEGEINGVPNKLLDLLEHNISAAITMGVDNANLGGLMGRLRINRDTFARIKRFMYAGFSLKSAILFANNPIVMDNSTKLLSKLNKAHKTVTEDKGLKYRDIKPEDFNPLVGDSIHEAGLIDNLIDLHALIQDIGDDYTKYPAFVLEDMIRLKKYDNDLKIAYDNTLNPFTWLFNMDSNGFPDTYGSMVENSKIINDKFYYPVMENLMMISEVRRSLEAFDVFEEVVKRLHKNDEVNNTVHSKLKKSGIDVTATWEVQTVKNSIKYNFLKPNFESLRDRLLALKTGKDRNFWKNNMFLSRLKVTANDIYFMHDPDINPNEFIAGLEALNIEGFTVSSIDLQMLYNDLSYYAMTAPSKTYGTSYISFVSPTFFKASPALDRAVANEIDEDKLAAAIAFNKIANVPPKGKIKSATLWKEKTDKGKWVIKYIDKKNTIQTFAKEDKDFYHKIGNDNVQAKQIFQDAKDPDGENIVIPLNGDATARAVKVEDSFERLFSSKESIPFKQLFKTVFKDESSPTELFVTASEGHGHYDNVDKRVVLSEGSLNQMRAHMIHEGTHVGLDETANIFQAGDLQTHFPGMDFEGNPMANELQKVFLSLENAREDAIDKMVAAEKKWRTEFAPESKPVSSSDKDVIPSSFLISSVITTDAVTVYDENMDDGNIWQRIIPAHILGDSNVITPYMKKLGLVHAIVDNNITFMPNSEGIESLFIRNRQQGPNEPKYFFAGKMDRSRNKFYNIIRNEVENLENYKSKTRDNAIKHLVDTAEGYQLQNEEVFNSYRDFFYGLSNLNEFMSMAYEMGSKKRVGKTNLRGYSAVTDYAALVDSNIMSAEYKKKYPSIANLIVKVLKMLKRIVKILTNADSANTILKDVMYAKTIAKSSLFVSKGEESGRTLLTYTEDANKILNHCP